MSVGCRIYKDFARPPKSLIEGFRGIPVANIDDCMNRTAAVQTEVVPYGKKELLGPAFTIKVPEGDNLMFHKAMDMFQPGDVLVIAAGGYTGRAIFGELMVHYCKLRKAAGIIVDGAIRDADEIAEMDFPVYAKSVIPNGPYKNGPGEINTPVSFAGITVRPGDIVVADGDGILFIDPEEAPGILKAVKEVVEKEKNIMVTQLRDGTYPRPWVDAKLREIGCEERDFWVR